MENKEYLKIKDEFKISDSHSKVRGVVVCRDINGNILFKKENMIVKSGRKLLMELLFNHLDNSATAEGKYTFYPIFGPSIDITEPDFNINTATNLNKSFGIDVTQRNELVTELNITANTITGITDAIASAKYGYLHFTNDKKLNIIPIGETPEDQNTNYLEINREDNLSIHCHFLKSGKPDSVNEPNVYVYDGFDTACCGLAYKRGENSYELFSRVTFPSYSPSTSLVFDYYIYF